MMGRNVPTFIQRPNEDRNETRASSFVLVLVHSRSGRTGRFSSLLPLISSSSFN